MKRVKIKSLLSMPKKAAKLRPRQRIALASAAVVALVGGGLIVKGFAAKSNSSGSQSKSNQSKYSAKNQKSDSKNKEKVSDKTQPNPNAKSPAHGDRSKITLDRFKKRIDDAVKRKMLSQAQADLLINQYNSLASFRNDLKAKPLTEKKTLISSKRKELTSWAKTNKIPTSFVGGLI